VEMYIEGGIRPVEIGTLLAGRFPEGHPQAGQNKIADLELLRLTNPRRVYSKSHLNYIVQVAKRLHDRRHEINGLQLTFEPPHLRHFGAKFRQLKREKTGLSALRAAADRESNVVSTSHPVEPFRNKAIRRISLIPKDGREAELSKTDNNLGNVLSNNVFIDLWTNVGMSSLTQEQKAAQQRGDESYAGSDSIYRMKKAVREVLNFFSNRSNRRSGG